MTKYYVKLFGALGGLSIFLYGIIIVSLYGLDFPSECNIYPKIFLICILCLGLIYSFILTIQFILMHQYNDRSIHHQREYPNFPNLYDRNQVALANIEVRRNRKIVFINFLLILIVLGMLVWSIAILVYPHNIKCINNNMFLTYLYYIIALLSSYVIIYISDITINACDYQ